MKMGQLSCGLLLLGLLTGTAVAGSISNGVWSPVGCGEKPAVPAIPDHDVKSFNAAMDAVNQWQMQVKQYFECLVKEANADNVIIAESANRQQAEHQKLVESLNTQIDAAEKKLTAK